MDGSLPELHSLDPSHQWRRIFCTSCGHSFDVPLSCKNRFCDTCTGPRRRRVRSRLIGICSAVTSQPGYRIRFLTLTIPVNDDLRGSAVRLIRSFRRLRQRKFWKSKVTGGCYVLEVKGSQGKWHLHLHGLVDSRFLDVYRLSSEWAKVSPGKIVFVKNVPIRAVICYVTKYITKSVLPYDTQIEASKALSGTRLFQPFGTWEAFATAVDRFIWTCPHCNRSTFLPASLLDRAFTDDYAKYIERAESLHYHRPPVTTYDN